MIENIVAYMYSITGLVFFVAWQMNYSLTKYFLKEKNFSKTLYLELFFLIIIMVSYYLSNSVFFILLFIIHASNIFTIIFLKDQILDSLEIFDSQIMEMSEMMGIKNLYFDGDMEAAPALAGQSVGLIDKVKSVEEIINETIFEFNQTVSKLNESKFNE